VLTLSGLRHAYRGKTVLEIAHWQVAQGASTLVLGASGSGKTTLLHILAGILRPNSGAVAVGGQDLAQLTATEIDRFRGRHIGIVLQKLHLVASLTVMHNLLLAQYLAGVAQDRARALELLDNLGLRDKAQHYPRELSHGQAQRVALARAVMNKPRLLLADEPTSNLDDARCDEACGLLCSVAQSCHATLIIATHDQRLRDRFADSLTLDAPA
jgi:ABC-type lipoprotein export system ATPase subunit